MFRKTGEGTWAPSNRLRKATPNFSSPLYGISFETARAFPGITLSSGPSMTATNRSVVGSGPILCPGKSLPSKYRMNYMYDE
jgi:hypothetical protein